MPGLAAAKSRVAQVRSEHPAATVPPQKKSVDKPSLAATRTMTKRVELAKTDPLAPLPDKHVGKTKDSPTGR
jgi:hypothetical protein